MDTELDAICELVRSCGRLVRDVDRTGLRIDTKEGKANFVTEYDRLVQERLRDGLAAIDPQTQFIGEEGSSVRYSDSGRFFVVDPIDGTTNFIKDYHHSSISVARVVDGEAELAVVCNPYTDEIFSARRGQGAFCNGKPIHASTEPLERGIVIFGTSPYREDLAEASFKLAYRYFRQAMDVRRSGSAALDLCAIAAGRAELFFEMSLAPWDHAAGALLVQEAGGVVTSLDGQALPYSRNSSVLARGPQVIPLD